MGTHLLKLLLLFSWDRNVPNSGILQYEGVKEQVSTIDVVIVGAGGKMGKEIIRGLVQYDDIKITGAADITDIGKDIGEITGGKPLGVTISASIGDLLDQLQARPVVIDFTHRDAARKNIPVVLQKGAYAVVGTTGLSADDLAGFEDLARRHRTGIMVAPNFSLGAVLMMKTAKEIARYLQQAEIIEYHNEKKVDAPSGTAIATARGMKESIEPSGNVTENGARGALYDGVRIHSVRLKSLVAHQEVLFAGHGELLTIRHDSFSRESFIPGIVLAVRKVRSWEGLKVGLDTIME